MERVDALQAQGFELQDRVEEADEEALYEHLEALDLLRDAIVRLEPAS